MARRNGFVKYQVPFVQGPDSRKVGTLADSEDPALRVVGHRHFSERADCSVAIDDCVLSSSINRVTFIEPLCRGLDGYPGIKRVGCHPGLAGQHYVGGPVGGVCRKDELVDDSFGRSALGFGSCFNAAATLQRFRGGHLRRVLHPARGFGWLHVEMESAAVSRLVYWV